MGLPTRPFDDREAEQQLSLEEWADGPYLSSSELATLSIRKGSLSARGAASRSRATSSTPTTSCRRSPGRASSSGFPRSPTPTTRSWTARATRGGSPAADIPIQSRMMTISDIYDALVAIDRPYKKAVPVEQGPRHPGGRGEAREAGPGPPPRVPRGEDLRAAGLQGTAQAEGVAGWPTPPLVIAHRGDSGAPPREHARRLRRRSRGGGGPRRARRAAHRGRPRHRHPRSHPRPDHHRPRRRAPPDPGRGPGGSPRATPTASATPTRRAGPPLRRGARAPAGAGAGSSSRSRPSR